MPANYLQLVTVNHHVRDSNAGFVPAPPYLRRNGVVPATGRVLYAQQPTLRFWRDYFTDPNGLPLGLPRVHPDQIGVIRTPYMRLMEALGSNTNRSPFVLLQNSTNAMLGLLEAHHAPMAPDRFQQHLTNIRNGGGSTIGSTASSRRRFTRAGSVEAIFSPMREVSASPLFLMRLLISNLYSS